MSHWRLIQLNFGKTVAHFGEVGIGLEETSERVRSDTLFSAWISSYARLFGKDDVEQLLSQFKTDSPPPFRHSSTFIYQCTGKAENEQNYIYYLPKPLKFPKSYPVGDDLKFTKQYKKLTYLPLKVWQRWYQGEGFTKSDIAELTTANRGEPNQDGKLYKAGLFDYGKSYQKNKLPKVAIDRNTSATNFYHTNFVQFQDDENEQSGLYFLLEFPQQESELEHKLHAAFHLLGEEGLGGERSSGAGKFDCKWLDLPKSWQDVIQFSGHSYHSLISLFWENDSSLLAQLANSDVSYEIQERGGWVSSFSSGRQERRKKVRMFTEGSVFPFEVTGQLADVTPPNFTAHSVYKSGISLSLPIIVATA